MSLWIVRSWGGIETDREGHSDPVTVIASHGEEWQGQPAMVDLVETDTEDGMTFLRSQSDVLSIEPAHDGWFPDVDEGILAITGGGTSWHRLAGLMKQPQATAPAKVSAEPRLDLRLAFLDAATKILGAGNRPVDPDEAFRLAAKIEAWIGR